MVKEDKGWYGGKKEKKANPPVQMYFICCLRDAARYKQVS